MHLKKLYKTLALVITVAMVLPHSWVGATVEGESSADTVTVSDEDDSSVEGSDGGSSEEDSSGEDNSGGDNSGEDNSGGDNSGGDNSGGDDSEGDGTEGDGTDKETPTPEPTPDAAETPTPEATPTPEETPGPETEPTETPTPEETPEPETTTENNTSGFGTNEALISAQQIINPSILLDSFRFSTIEKVYAVVNVDELNIYEDKDEAATVVGRIKKDGLCFIIKEEEDSEWIFIESGVVRGFVRTESLILGDQADQIVEEKQEENLLLAESLVDPLDNGALTYTRTTVRETVVDKVYAITTVDNVNVREEQNTESRVVGELPKNTICYILADDSEEWVFVESDDVRGFVNKDMITYGDELESQIAENGGWTDGQEDILKQQKKDLKSLKAELSQKKADKKDQQAALEQAEQELEQLVGSDLSTVQEEEVKDTEKTSDETQKEDQTEDLQDSEASEEADKETAASSPAELETQIDELTEAVDSLENEIDELKQLVDDQKAAIEEGKLSKQESLANAEEGYQKAVKVVEPKDNKACYYTLTSTKQASVASSIGEAMITYASQFLGNPYVWGGTSLTHGTDCSGFTQGIYSAFGYSIPRTSGEQSQYGTQIPISEARTGDLIFYANNGTVYHVVMYIGDGQVIHASSSRTGIITSGIDTAHAVWATRIISDDDYDQVEAINNAVVSSGVTAYTNATTADVGQYLGDFKLTAYCNCTICCGKWSGGPTASGTVPTEGRTVAMAGVPFGTKLIINGRIYTVEDRGTPYGHVDIYMNDHDVCNQFGVQYAQVYLAN